MHVPITIHDDELLAFAAEILAGGDKPREYGGHYTECPGCARLVHHSDRFDHPARCQALRDHAAWCAGVSLPETTR